MTAATHAASDRLFFLKEFIRNPRMVGSIIATSRTAVCALLDPIDWGRVRCIVEYGPGTGVFTREILRRMGPDARLIAIDINATFVTHLRDVIRDERLISVEGSAVDVEAILGKHGFDTADYVISGLPFSTLPCALGDAIMDATAHVITPGGAFLIYQYSQFVLPALRRRFGRVDKGYILRCIPPARLFWAWKDAADLTAAGVESSAAA